MMPTPFPEPREIQLRSRLHAERTPGASRPWIPHRPDKLVLIVTILITAKAVIVPLALAVLLTFILTPIVTAVQGLGMRRLPAVLVVALLTFMVIGALVWALEPRFGILR